MDITVRPMRPEEKPEVREMFPGDRADAARDKAYPELAGAEALARMAERVTDLERRVSVLEGK